MGSTLKLRAGVLVLASLLFADVARADDDPTALELSKQGYELLLEKKCDKAIDLLKRSLELDPKPRTLVNLARCEDQLGTLRAALAHLNEARALARKLSIDAMVTQLDTMVSDMEKRIPHVELKGAASAPPGTTVTRGGETIQPGTIALDPGLQTLVVSAPNREPATITFTLAEGETKVIVAMPGGPIAAPPPPVTSAPPASTPRRSSPLRTVGVANMIAGGAGLIAGGIFGAIALGKKGDAEDAGCKGSVCPNPPAGDLRDDARSAGTISTVMFVAGGVLAAGGLGMFILAPSASSDRAGLTLSGRF